MSEQTDSQRHAQEFVDRLCANYDESYDQSYAPQKPAWYGELSPESQRAVDWQRSQRALDRIGAPSSCYRPPPRIL